MRQTDREVGAIPSEKPGNILCFNPDSLDDSCQNLTHTDSRERGSEIKDNSGGRSRYSILGTMILSFCASQISSPRCWLQVWQVLSCAKMATSSSRLHSASQQEKEKPFFPRPYRRALSDNVLALLHPAESRAYPATAPGQGHVLLPLTWAAWCQPWS